MKRYDIDPQDAERLARDFVYHPPSEDQVIRYEELRRHACEFAALILVSCPPSRERSVALTELSTTVMWANASIARNEQNTGTV